MKIKQKHMEGHYSHFPFIYVKLLFLNETHVLSSFIHHHLTQQTTTASSFRRRNRRLPDLLSPPPSQTSPSLLHHRLDVDPSFTIAAFQIRRSPPPRCRSVVNHRPFISVALQNRRRTISDLDGFRYIFVTKTTFRLPVYQIQSDDFFRHM